MIFGVILILCGVLGRCVNYYSERDGFLKSCSVTLYSVIMVIIVVIESILAICFMIMIGKSDVNVFGIKEDIEIGINDTYIECCNSTSQELNKNCNFLKSLNASCSSVEEFRKSCIDEISSVVTPIYVIFVIIIVVEVFAFIIVCCIGRRNKRKGKNYANISDEESVVGLRIK